MCLTGQDPSSGLIIAHVGTDRFEPAVPRRKSGLAPKLDQARVIAASRRPRVARKGNVVCSAVQLLARLRIFAGVRAGSGRVQAVSKRCLISGLGE